MTQAAILNKLWIFKKISPELEELSRIPLFGHAPSFDWEKLSSVLSSRLNREKFFLQPGRSEWKESHALREGLGSDIIVTPLEAPSLSGSIYWLMPRQEIQKLTSSMLSQSQSMKTFSSPILQEGFYRYLLLQMLDVASEIEPLQTLTFLLGENSSLPEEKMFCIDVQIHFDGTVCTGRLAVPSTFRVNWCQHFDQLYPYSISPKLARSLELSLSVHTGSVLLHLSQWDSLKKGDFILLDKGSYDPRHETGLASLALGNTPLFQVSVQSNQLHLLNFAFIYEDAADMETNIPPEEDSFEEETNDDLSLTNEEEGETVALRDTPIYITIELARLRVTLEKLMELSPGNVLDLPIAPDQSVNLLANGKKIGKAELVYLGEKLGVRILELG